MMGEKSRGECQKKRKVMRKCQARALRRRSRYSRGVDLRWRRKWRGGGGGVGGFPGHGGGRFMYCLFRTFSRAPASRCRTFPTGTMLSEAGHPAYAERAADLLGDDDPAEVVDSSDNSGSFHTVSNPSCDLMTLLSGSSDSTIIIRSCVQVIPAPPGAIFGGPAGRSP